MKKISLQEPFAPVSVKEFFLGFFFSALILFSFYPDFVLFNETPMHSAGWELSDSAVSHANFKPSFRVFQKELYDHGNFLWSSLRTMGMPILGNDIQAAPLFPLTLMFSWVGEDFFWNLIVISRLVLMGLGLYLLLTKFFRFQRLPALFFIITFVYSLYVLRWINNPWQNGLLSGIWYLYFLFEITIQKRQYGLKRFGVFLGLVIGVYSMVTNGFPEASVMCAILVVLVYGPFLLSRIFSRKLLWKSYFFDLTLAHIVGFSLSSYQIFAIIELLNISESFRHVGLQQYPLESLFPFFAENITQFNEQGPQLFKDSRTYFGLIPLTFFFAGICKTFFKPLKNGFGEVGALLCGIFMVVKLFPIGPEWINRFIADHPILVESYFFVYFFSIFIWFFSYFTAKGFQSVFKLSFTNAKKIIRWQLLLVILPVCVLILLGFASHLVTEKHIWDLVFTENRNSLQYILVLFLIAILSTHIYLYFGKRKYVAVGISACVLLLMGCENLITLPKQFSGLYKKDYYQLNQILDNLEHQNIPLTESRIIDRDGDYVSKGVATIDTGATPLLPIRTKSFRNHFFYAGVGGHLSIKRPKSKYSWSLTSTNIRSVDRFYGGDDNVLPKWETLEFKEGGDIHFEGIKINNKTVKKDSLQPINISLRDHIYFSGWGIGSKDRFPKYTNTYIILKNTEGEITIPTKRQPRQDVAQYFGSNKFLQTGFETYVSTAVFQPASYKVAIRIVDHTLQHYYERSFPLIVEFKQDKPLEKDGLKNYSNYLGMLNYSYVYLNRDTLPRAYTASKCTVFKSLEEVEKDFQTTTTFAPGKVYMEEIPPEKEQFCEEYNGEVKRIKILYDHGNEVLLDEIQGPAIIVLNDNIYPGWKAKDLIRNTPVDIHPTNITFRGILLPEKREYKILFKYRPQWLWIAHTAAFTAVLILCYLLITLAFPNWRIRKQPS